MFKTESYDITPYGECMEDIDNSSNDESNSDNDGRFPWYSGKEKVKKSFTEYMCRTTKVFRIFVNGSREELLVP